MKRASSSTSIEQLHKELKQPRVDGILRGRTITSLQVFLSYVTVDEKTKTTDVSRVFSMDCFRYWLQTRPNEIKHPEQSFQRALYAHIRGADGRKSFSQSIEKALLWELRQESNPWTRMFGENVFKLGKKGFKRRGYHEEKAHQKEVLAKWRVTRKTGALHNFRSQQPVPGVNPLFLGANLPFQRFQASENLFPFPTYNLTSPNLMNQLILSNPLFNRPDQLGSSLPTTLPLSIPGYPFPFPITQPDEQLLHVTNLMRGLKRVESMKTIAALTQGLQTLV